MTYIARMLLSAIAAMTCLLFSWRADAAAARCEGPIECCPSDLRARLDRVQDVSLGVVLVSLSNVAERNGTWDADYYLYERWRPVPGFTPQTEIVNEASRLSEQYDEVELEAGFCVRSRRIRSTLRSHFDLRLFPFDHQRLSIQFSDERYDLAQLRYTAAPLGSGLDGSIKQHLSNWNVDGELRYSIGQQSFGWEDGVSDYTLGEFSLGVARRFAFHITKYFLPLLVIWVVSFSVFWLDPDDVGSAAGVGVTCLLAAIAQQYAEDSVLPEVDYLTLADRAFAICYSSMGVAVLLSVYTNRLSRSDARGRAVLLKHRARWLFPALSLALMAGVVVRATTQT